MKREIAIWSDFYWCRKHQIRKEVESRRETEKDMASRYILIPLPRNEYVPTQKFIEEVIDLYFTNET